MKCHYEVLEIPIHADDSEIKSAYRKLALKWHPDKNIDSPELAKEQFQILQQAYEVLSDRQERAWYDAHRDQILRGRSSEFEDKSLDVFQYFTTTCFKGYGDDENGFYTIYREVFEQIAKEDLEFIDDKEDFCEIPGFGRSESDYEEFKTFYDYWMSYSTKKSYSWLDPYDIRDGKGDRRLLKIIDKENKKVRLKAKKERNEEVRNLVAFVRKRDKRVQAYKKELYAKTLENRTKQKMLSDQKRLERKKLHDTEKQADWLKFHNLQSKLEEVEKNVTQEFGDELSNSEEEDFNNLYCVACNKMFKTPKAFENHEFSKKHKENVEIIKESMLEEDMESNMTDELDEYNDSNNDDDALDKTFEENGVISDEESIGDEENMAEISGNVKKKKQKGKNKKTFNQSMNENKNLTDDDIPEDLKQANENPIGVEEDNDLDKSDEQNDGGEQEIEISNKKIKKKNKKARNVLNDDHILLSDELHKKLVLGDVSDDDFDFSAGKNQRKKNKKGSTNKSKSNTNEEKADQKPSSTVEVDNNDKPSSIVEEGRKSKKSSKKEKKVNKKDVQGIDLTEIDTSHCCVSCKKEFPSKNKLFEHLKKTGHGVYIPSNIKKENKSNVKN